MIRTFGDRRTADLARGHVVKGAPPDVARRAVSKLFLLDTVTRLDDLRVPPGNRLEALTGTRAGSTRYASTKWRICFIWTIDGVRDVEFVDDPYESG